MKTIAIRATLGLFLVTASLVVARSASAQTVVTYMNADTSNGPYYLGVSGGAHCNSAGQDCYLTNGQNIITYQASGNDQQWFAPAAEGTGHVPDYYFAENGDDMCLGVAAGSKSNGASLVIWDCTGNPLNQQWQVKKAEDYGAPYTGCFIFINQNSGQVMGVAAGEVGDGAQVVQWPFYLGPDWHPDQFWCPTYGY